MNAAVGFYTLLGLAVALLGFARRPRTAGELVYPRFVVPLLFWLLGIFPAAYYYYMETPKQQFEPWRLLHQERAMQYILLCMGMFWIGFRLRIRIPRLERTVQNLSIRFDYPRIQRAGLFIVTITAGFLFVVFGSDIWNGHDVLDRPGAVGYIAKFMILPLNVLAAIAYGFGWPQKGEPRRSIAWVGALYVLALCTLPLAANFSRGSGLFPMFMVLGYVGRFRRLPWVSLALSIFFLVFCAHVALDGRAVYGHSGGAQKFMTHFFDLARNGDFNWANATERFMSGEALTPLSVVLAADTANTDLRPLSPLHWIFFQIPLPHMFGFGGTYTLDATIFLGGVGHWGFTASMFGDTFGHFGWWGCMAFIYMGMLYRILEELVANYDNSLIASGSLAFLTLPVAYYAFLLGTFNTFRAWNSAFTFGIALILIALWIYAKLKNSSNDDYIPAHAGDPAA